MNGVQVAVLPSGAGAPAISRPASVPRRERITLPLVAFFALGLYGVIRWDTLLGGGSFGRLFGLLVLGSVLAVAGPVLAGVSRWLAVGLFVLGLWAAFAIAGLPLDWVVHLRVAVSARAIGNGLSALPQINVPYTGINQWVRVTLLLGAMILVLDAALVLTFVPRRLGLVRRAGAALPLVALSVIPATALRPRGPYLEGALLFALVVAFVWGDRIENRRLGGVLAPCAVALAVAVALAPSLDRHHSWVNYRQLAASLAPSGVESFNWTQGYGPLHWPNTGKSVLYIQAPHGGYWKAENLEVFNGHGWVASQAPASPPWQTGVSRSAIARWSQTLQVTLDAMSTSKVIAEGSTIAPPASLPGPALPGSSPGTYLSERRLEPGSSYRVHVYAPHPTVTQLASDSDTYPATVADSYLSILVPVLPGLSGAAAAASPATGALLQVVFPPFDPRHSPVLESPAALAATMAASPYSRVYRLAQRLKSASSTPYAFVQRVMRYLGHGYRYSQSPPVSRYPLQDFLFVHKLGYCQQFAGAMALLLRMGGVPARVAVGFTPGIYDRPSRRWVVSDLNAHAWVEAWFPRYGWIHFDPTPAVDPALAPALPPGAGTISPTKPATALRRHHDVGGGASLQLPGAKPSASRGGGVSGLVVAPAVILALLALLAALTRARGSQDPVGELAQAFARSGRPLDRAATLSGLEHRLAFLPDAAGYVRALRLGRYGPGEARVPAGSLLSGRRALRRALGAGLGPLGRARAWWALPPRWRWPGRR